MSIFWSENATKEEILLRNLGQIAMLERDNMTLAVSANELINYRTDVNEITPDWKLLEDVQKALREYKSRLEHELRELQK